MKKTIIGIVLVFAIAVAGFYLIGAAMNGNVVANGPTVKTFVVTGDHLRFFVDGLENPDMKVNLGDRVRIEFVSTEGFHDWKIDEFNAATEKVNPGTTTVVEFVADKQGTFEYYCSVGKHRANGMKGNFIVE